MFPITEDKLNQVLHELGIVDVTTATIRQIVSLAGALEKVAGEKFVHLEIGNPGLPAEQIGVNAECDALRTGIANKYPPIQGIPQLKEAGSRFLKAFLDINVPAKSIVPTVGSMQGTFTLFILMGQRKKGKDTILFLDPGFPAQHNQAKLLGLKTESFDIYDYRNEKLEPKLEEVLSKGNISAIIYSNPNNPAWTNLTAQELSVLGRMATKYDAIVMEDLAYLGMDFRQDFSRPFEPPFIQTIAKHTDNYICLVSASKIFSYAGQRVALVCMSEEVYNKTSEEIEKFYEMPNFGDAYIYGVLYCASSGTSHAAQYALTAMMESATRGELPFVTRTREYGRRAKIVKRLFLENGFHIVYDKDGDDLISDGFFFTAGYKDMDSATLQKELIRYGVSAISLPSTGSKQKGLRICVSVVNTDDDFNALEQRLKAFNNEH